MRRALIIVGAVVLLAGLLWPWLGRLPLGHLPGDIVIARPGFRFYFPITTLIIVSVLVTLLLHLFRR
ncbi:MAG TPA: DUF2905 domain-containing protein [Steroidobacteraceae bacterium]|jgi:hypothetical protein|nr:DUF2905 domain-containing protein [Steroidobacteraceae bacterium]